MKTSERIKNAGLKVTPQRKIVYESMCCLEHSAIDAVITDVREQHPDISVATIYRIMESFCEVGLLLKFIGPNGRTFFDITPHEHLHLFTSKDTIIDLKDSSLTELIHRHVLAQLPPGECLDKISICITTKAIQESSTSSSPQPN